MSSIEKIFLFLYSGLGTREKIRLFAFLVQTLENPVYQKQQGSQKYVFTKLLYNINFRNMMLIHESEQQMHLSSHILLPFHIICSLQHLIAEQSHGTPSI
jgi:hypothetical protein